MSQGVAPGPPHGRHRLPMDLWRPNEGEIHEEPREEEVQPDSRTSTSVKRRKRGARKNKGKDVQPEQVDLTLETLAEASQTLAREISRTSKVSANGYVIDLSVSATPVPPVPPIPNDAVPSTPTVTKKPSKWKLSFGKSNSLSTFLKPRATKTDVHWTTSSSSRLAGCTRTSTHGPAVCSFGEISPGLKGTIVAAQKID